MWHVLRSVEHLEQLWAGQVVTDLSDSQRSAGMIGLIRYIYSSYIEYILLSETRNDRLATLPILITGQGGRYETNSRGLRFGNLVLTDAFNANSTAFVTSIKT